MDKLILISVILATIFIPSGCARIKSPRRGLVVTVSATAAFMIIYALLLLLVAMGSIKTDRPPSMWW